MHAYQQDLHRKPSFRVRGVDQAARAPWFSSIPPMALGERKDPQVQLHVVMEPPLHLFGQTSLLKRRVNGLLRIGETEAEFLVTDENLKPEEIVQIGLVSAIHRQALSDAEIYQGRKKLMKLYPYSCEKNWPWRWTLMRKW